MAGGYYDNMWNPYYNGGYAYPQSRYYRPRGAPEVHPYYNRAEQEPVHPYYNRAEQEPVHPYYNRREQEPLKKVVKTIPVMDGNEAPVPKAPVEAVPKAPVQAVPVKARFESEDAAATKIQAVFRGYCVRKTQPLKHLKVIKKVKGEFGTFKTKFQDMEQKKKLCSDSKERLRWVEGIMALLLQLDSLQGVHPEVRLIRKPLTKELLMFQETIDTLSMDSLNGQEDVSTMENSEAPQEGEVTDAAALEGAEETDAAAPPEDAEVTDAAAPPVDAEVTDAAAPEDSEVADAGALEDVEVTDAAAPEDAEVTDAAAPEDAEVTGAAAPEDAEVTGAAAPEDAEVTGAAAPEDAEVTDAAAPEDVEVTDAAAPEDAEAIDAAAPADAEVTVSAAPEDAGVFDAATPGDAEVTDATALQEPATQEAEEVHAEPEVVESMDIEESTAEQESSEAVQDMEAVEVREIDVKEHVDLDINNEAVNDYQSGPTPSDESMIVEESVVEAGPTEEAHAEVPMEVQSNKEQTLTTLPAEEAEGETEASLANAGENQGVEAETAASSPNADDNQDDSFVFVAPSGDVPEDASVSRAEQGADMGRPDDMEAETPIQSGDGCIVPAITALPPASLESQSPPISELSDRALLLQVLEENRKLRDVVGKVLQWGKHQNDTIYNLTSRIEQLEQHQPPLKLLRGEEGDGRKKVVPNGRRVEKGRRSGKVGQKRLLLGDVDSEDWLSAESDDYF